MDYTSAELNDFIYNNTFPSMMWKNITSVPGKITQG